MNHPQGFLSNEEIRLIRSQTFICEEEKKLSSKVLELICQKQWLRVTQPKAVGGLEWPFPKIVQLFESLTWADANVGWVVNLGAGANLFSGYLEESAAKEIFNSDRIWCAGSGAISGKAVVLEEGFLISGNWKYASGSAHATHITANCFLEKNGKAVLLQDGSREFRSFIFPKESVEILNSWKVTGLKATSSNDFKVESLLVPKEWSFSLIRPSDFANAALFHFPFDVLAVVNMAIMPVAIAIHFLDLFEELMATKRPLGGSDLLQEKSGLQELFETLKKQLFKERKEFYRIINEYWSIYSDKQVSHTDLNQKLIQQSKMTAKTARDLVHQLYPYCGMSIVFEHSELNKVWRDLSVASQHYLLLP